MPKSCPITSLNEWKTLEKELGYAAAMRAYELNGEQIPNIDKAKELLNVKGQYAKAVEKIENVEIVNGFYSPLEKIISESKQDKMPVKQWMDKFAKGEEAKWTGLQDWLGQQQGSITKQDILDYLKNNRIEIVEVVKGGEGMVFDYDNAPQEVKDIIDKYPDDAYDAKEELEALGYEVDIDMDGTLASITKKGTEPTSFHQYQLEGEKENYKEVLVTLPSKEPKIEPRKASDYSIKVDNESKFTGQRDVIILKNGVESGRRYGTSATDEEIINDHISKLDAEDLKQKKKEGQFKSTHFSEANILVHLRMNTRIDADGKKVLFLEEVQSDWGQKGKKEGFKSEEAYKKADEAYGKFLDRMKSKYGKDYDEYYTKEEYDEEYTLLGNRDAAENAKIPAAPFVMDTNAWTKLGLKVALKEAVAQGVDKIAWTTGEQQNDRYDLSKQVDEIIYTKNNDNTFDLYAIKNGQTVSQNFNKTIKEIESIAGKDIADKILNEEGVDVKGTTNKSLKGDNLKVGGKGMKGFYGSIEEGTKGIVGGVAEKLFGQNLGKTEITIDENTTSTQASVEVTPSLIKQVGEGLPRFQAETEISPQTPISKTVARAIQNLLSAAFPFIKVQFLSQEEYQNKFNANTTAAVGTDGVVYINSAKVNKTTQLHEFGHVWVSWAKRYNPKLYRKGMELAASDTATIERVKKEQPNLRGAALLDEVLAIRIGEYSSEAVENALTKSEDASVLSAVSDFVKNLFKSIKQFLGVRTKYEFPEDMETMNMADFVSNIHQALLSGNMISEMSSAELSEIESELGIPRHQMYNNAWKDKHHVNDYGASTKRVVDVSFNDTKDRVVTDLQTVYSDVLRNNPIAQTMPLGVFMQSADAILPLRNYFGEILNDIKDRIDRKNYGTSVNPANKAFSNNAIEAFSELNMGKYDNELREIAAELLNMSGNFDMNNLSDKAKKVFTNLVRDAMQQQNFAANGDDIILGNGQKITKDEQQRIGEQEIGSFRAWVNGLKQKNPILAKVIDFVEKKYLMEVASGPLWAKMMSGKNNGIIASLSNALTMASGVKTVIIENANANLIKLYEKDWLKGGSQTLNPNAKFSELNKIKVAGVEVTMEEAFDMFMVLQQKNVRGRLMAQGGAKFHVQEFTGDKPADNRPAQDVTLQYSDYDTLFNQFDPYWDDVNESWVAASEYIFDEVNKVFKVENGVNLSKVVPRTPTDRWNVYYPMITGRGKDSVRTFLKQNNFVNDIASQKARSATVDTVYYAGNAFQRMESYVQDNAQYAAYALPLMNMKRFLANNEAYLIQNGMKDYIEWFNKTERHMFEGDPNELGKVGSMLLNGFVVSRLGLNPFVDLKQFTSVPLATTAIPSKYILKAQKALFGTLIGQMKNYDIFTDWMGKDKQMVAILEEMKNHNPYAFSRIVGGTNEVQKAIQEGWFRKTKLRFAGREIEISNQDFLKNIKTLDNATGAMIWQAAKTMVETETSLTPGSQDYWDKVNDLYIKAVTESQSSIDDWNRPYFPKSGTILSRSLSLFAGQSFAAFNGFLNRMIDYRYNPTPATRAKFYKSFMNIFVINSLMVAAVDTLRWSLLSPDADDPEKEKEIFDTSLFRAMYQNLPILSPIIDAAYNSYQDPVFGRELSYPIFEIINNGADLVANAAKGKEDKAIEEAVYFGAGTIGLPLTPIRAAKKAFE